MTVPPSPLRLARREAYARIIDPVAWRFYDLGIEHPELNNYSDAPVNISLKKAERIMGLEDE